MKNIHKEQDEINYTRGDRIRLLMFAKENKTAYSLAKEMEGKEDSVTRGTITNAMEGKNIELYALKIIAKALDVKVEMLIAKDAPMLDEFLKLVVEPLYEEYECIKQEIKSKEFSLCNDYDYVKKIDKDNYKKSYNYGEVILTNCEPYEYDDIDLLEVEFFVEPDEAGKRRMDEIINELKQRDYISEAKLIYDIQNSFYPSIASGIKANDFKYPIMTMAEFLILLPLCEWSDVMDIAERVDSSILEREDYILEQINRLYYRLPDSPEKRYITHQIIQTRYGRKPVLNEAELNFKREVDEYKKTIGYWEEYFAYREHYR